MTLTSQTEDAAVLAAIRTGDEGAFAALAERYRRQLHIHCYRMLGSFEDAEDLVQETLLRAWRGRAGFAGRAQFRTWLYRIATNACLNALTRTPRQLMPPECQVTATSAAPSASDVAAELPWLQPYPDRLLEPAAPAEIEPHNVVISRETIELAFLAAIQHLPPRQRAILILRDALAGRRRKLPTCSTRVWPPSIVPSSAHALRCAPGCRGAGSTGRPATAPSDEERAVLSATWMPTTAPTRPPWQPCCARMPA